MTEQIKLAVTCWSRRYF